MKWLNQISIKVKVMLPICILGIVILLASISSLVNSKRLLQAGVVISQDCSKSIELLMDMSSELESMGKNMYGHCDAENSISKESFATSIHEKLESMDSYFKQYKKQKKTAREKEYFGALQNRFKKYKEGMEQVLTASSKGDADGATEAINVIQKPSEDYLAKKISSLIAMRKQAMNDSLQAQQAAYEFSRNSAIVFIAVSTLMILFSLWICLKGIVAPMHYISQTLQKMVADIEKNQGDLSVRLKISGKDEIGKVGRNVNAFIDTLQNVMGRITDSSLRMNQIIREVDDKVRSSNENSDDISAAMEELSASMISAGVWPRCASSTMPTGTTTASTCSPPTARRRLLPVDNVHGKLALMLRKALRTARRAFRLVRPGAGCFRGSGSHRFSGFVPASDRYARNFAGNTGKASENGRYAAGPADGRPNVARL